MVDNPIDLNISFYSEGKNIHCTSPTRISKVCDSSQPKPEWTCEIPYIQIQAICPIACQFAKFVGLISGVLSLPYSLKKNKTTPTGIVISTLEYFFLSTLQELVDSVENAKEPPLFHGSDEDTLYSQTQVFAGQA